MKDEEIDDVLKETARGEHVLKAGTLQRVSDSIKTSLRPVLPLPPTWVLASGLVLVCAAVALAGAARAGFYGIEKMDLLERALIFSALAVSAWIAGIGFVNEMVPGAGAASVQVRVWRLSVASYWAYLQFCSAIIKPATFSPRGLLVFSPASSSRCPQRCSPGCSSAAASR